MSNSSFQPASVHSESPSALGAPHEVHKKLSDVFLRPSRDPSVGPYNEGHAWGPSDFAENTKGEIVQRLSKSQFSLKELVETARRVDPEAFQKALSDVVHQQTDQGTVNKWSTQPLVDLATEFETDLVKGLSEDQAAVNYAVYGPNLLEEEKREPTWRIFLEHFMSTVVLLLCCAAVVSFAFQEIAEGVVITVIVLLNATLATYMEKSAGDALAKLANMAVPHCRVIRGGADIQIDSKQLVPGDIVLVGAGDSIPADLRLIELVELKTNEAILTGESEVVKKTLEPTDRLTPFATNLCFASTSATNGSGRGMVYATGMDSQVGKIAEHLAKESAKGKKLTPLQIGLNKLGGLIGILAICVLCVIVIIAIFTKYEDPSHPDSNRVLAIVLVAVGFAVSAIPEGLPMVVTICLSLGCQDLVKRKANVRKLPAVETLGCCTTICSDKTGTLTEGKMTAVTLVTVCRNVTNQQVLNEDGISSSMNFYPTKGFNPNGGIFLEKMLDDALKTDIHNKFDAGVFQNFEDKPAGLLDYGSPDNGTNGVGAVARGLCLGGLLNSHATKLEKDQESGQWTTSGNMSEGAVVVAAAKARFAASSTGLSGVVDPFENYRRVPEAEVPFNSSRKMMATVHVMEQHDYFDKLHLGGGGMFSDSSVDVSSTYTHVAILKGAPDRVVQKVKFLLGEDASGQISVDWKSRVTENELAAVYANNNALSEGALRVLAFTLIPLTTNEFEKLTNCEDADDRLKLLLAGPIVLMGVVGSLDPPRVGVTEAIQKCRTAGVRVIMITGDQVTTATAIAKQIKLLRPNDSSDECAIMCAELHVNGDAQREYINEAELDAITSRVSVFSRAQPEDKIEIVNSLKNQGEVVAMTGDGVNDAPALKAADIGVAMGISGTDVAKGAAEMVLLDDNFVTIVAAIEEGRKIYANIQKFVCFLLGTNIGEIIYLTVAISAGMKMPVEALQILFLNLMSDGCPAVALSREPPDEDNMRKPPRKKDAHIMTFDWWVYGILPHTIFEAMCVIASLVVAMYMATGVVTLDQIDNQCLKAPGDHSSAGARYFCATYEYRFNAGLFRDPYQGWVTNVDFVDSDGQMRQILGAFEGKNYDILPSDLGVTSCIAGEDDNGFCYAESKISGYTYVTARASRVATTQSFITAVFCEMLRAYTVRSWAPWYTVFNRNPWMHMACSMSATLTIMITIIPWINVVFGVTYVEWWHYLLAISWGILNLIADETIPKPIYRKVLRDRKKKHAALTK